MKKQFLIIFHAITFTVMLHASQPKQQLPTDSRGYTSVHNAALANDPLTIQALCQAFPEELNRQTEAPQRNKQQSYQDTPAHVAAYHGCWNALTILVALGANLRIKNHSGKTVSDNVLNNEMGLYRESLRKAHTLRKELTEKLIHQSTQTTPIQISTQSSEIQTEPMQPYHEEITITKRYYGQPAPVSQNPQPITKNPPPPYRPPLGQTQSHQLSSHVWHATPEATTHPSPPKPSWTVTSSQDRWQPLNPSKKT